jgi:hypothetical protein
MSRDTEKGKLVIYCEMIGRSYFFFLECVTVIIVCKIKKLKIARRQWLIPVILAIWETEIGRLEV